MRAGTPQERLTGTFDRLACQTRSRHSEEIDMFSVSSMTMDRRIITGIRQTC
jgi:hypothetical protein